MSFYAFSDHDREVLGETVCEETVLEDSIEVGKRQVELWMKSYAVNRWENQPLVPEVWIEKKALQGVFGEPCRRLQVALAPCKGYPSLTFLNEAKDRFNGVKDRGLTPVILYFGDYDPSGEDIPRSIEANLERLGCHVEVKRYALLEEQVVSMGLPPAPVKSGDSRTANWGGLGQVELDAVKPEVLRQMCAEAIEAHFDGEAHSKLKERERQERPLYIKALKEHVNGL